MADIYFIGVEDGSTAYGQLAIPSKGFTTSGMSGPWGQGDTPAGQYRIVDDATTAKTSEDGMTFPGHRVARKFHLAAKGPDGQYHTTFKDAHGNTRKDILIHADGGKWVGTLGCIGIRGTPGSTGLPNGAADAGVVTQAEDDLNELDQAGQRDVSVEYYKTPEEAAARMKELGFADKDIDRKNFEAPKKPDPPPAKKKGSGKPSRVRRGRKIVTGEASVLVGDTHLAMAYVDSVHEGGARIVRGSPSVFVGKNLRPAGRVDDPTSDGDRVATGEETVAVG